MSFFAEAELIIDAPREVVFDRLSDHGSWPSWMPASFRPVGRSVGTLRVGEALMVRIAGMPFPARLEVSRARRPDEVAWTGGLRGLLWAEHRFLFETVAPRGTRVRSLEVWHGPLARLLRRAIQPRATRIGGEQLDGLARSVRAS